MLSILRKGLVYKDISPDIVEHDLNTDAEQWSYDDRDVYRGTFDPRYTAHGLNVYWLYDDNLNRVGLAEHEASEPEVFKSLWFHENPFATLTQDTNWKSTGKTLWSRMSSEAYQDCLDEDFATVRERALNSNVLLVTPKFLIEPPQITACSKCNKKGFGNQHCRSPTIVLDISQFSKLFIDHDFVIHECVGNKSPDTESSDLSLTSTAPPCDASVGEQQARLDESAGPPELQERPPVESPEPPRQASPPSSPLPDSHH